MLIPKTVLVVLSTDSSGEVAKSPTIKASTTATEIFKKKESRAAIKACMNDGSFRYAVQILEYIGKYYPVTNSQSTFRYVN